MNDVARWWEYVLVYAALTVFVVFAWIVLEQIVEWVTLKW